MKNIISLGKLTALLVAFTVTGGLTHAQTAPAPATPEPKQPARVVPSPVARSSEDEVVILSPFEVTASADTGYAAATSLAGNRLNTELRDVGSAISVVTAQFLRDVGATSNATLLQYATNSEVGGIQGTMANSGSGTQLDETNNLVRPNSNTRIRGLAAADNTRDYFISDIPWDGYNIDRIDFQRGPNAILFGLGSPAGIINAGTHSAGFRNQGSVEFRYSRFGSMRTTLDINQVLLERELAFRLDVLNNDEKFQQKPAFQRDQRLYGAVRYEPKFLNKGSAHTTLKANIEVGKIRSNNPRSLTPGDAVTPWFLTGTFQGYDAKGNPFTYNNPSKMAFNATTLNENTSKLPGRNEFNAAWNDGTVNPSYQPWLGGQYSSNYFGNPLAVFDSGDSSAFRLINIAPTTPRGISPTGTIDQGIGGIPPYRNVSLTIYRDVSKKVNLFAAKFGLTRNLQLSDPSIFDFYNHLIDGPNKSEWQNFRTYNVNLSQTLLDGKVGFEAVFNKEHYDNGRLSFMTDKGQAIFIDLMQVYGDGTVNPNFGRPFIADSSANNKQGWSDRDSLRLTGFAQHDFDKGQHHSILTRLAGRHILTGLYSRDTVKTDNRDFSRWVTDEAYKDMIAPSSTIVTIGDARRNVYPTIYLGPSLFNMSSAVGAHIPGPTALALPKSGSIRAFDSTWAPGPGINPGDVWINTFYPEGNTRRTSTQSENPANYRGLVNTPITIIDSEDGNRDQNTRQAQRTLTKLSSKAAVWQGYLWDGSLVGMYGYREDISRAWGRTASVNAVGQANLDSTSYTTNGATQLRVADNSTSWSVVAHLSQIFDKRERLPVQLSVFYNKSSNFQPNALRVDPYGQPLSAPTGRTEDMGILLATRDNHYSLKINRYESNIVNASGSGINAFYLGQLWTDYNRWYNIFNYKLGGETLDTANTGDPIRYTYQAGPGQTAAEAVTAQAADVAGWAKLVNSVPKEFFTAWQIDPTNIGTYRYVTPIGFSQPENNTSKGYEIEFFAEPKRNLRLTFNASKSEATRKDVGGAVLSDLVTLINTALNTTPAGSLRSSSSSSSATALQAWNANFFATWTSLKVQEGANVPELRKWRFNLVANYDFKEGMLKGFNVGAGYRWQDRVVIGYPPVLNNQNHVLATEVNFDLAHPFYGPSESDIDLWIGYERALSRKYKWRTQVNVRNVGKGNDLIPVTVQPDGTPAGWRIAPAQVWSLTNTLSF